MQLFYKQLGVCFLFVCALSTAKHTSAQSITVSGGLTATEMANKLIGNNVTISNATFSGSANSSGEFSQGTSSFPISDGILLTSGSINNALGPNTSSSLSESNGTPGDSDLETLIPGFSTFDAAVLEFDVISNCDELTIDYIFASEEYPEFACSNFNDAFGFFIIGPGYPSLTNIALVPGTTTPVSINNVINRPPDCVSHPSFYVDNPPGSAGFEYDGRTTVLAARATLVPCQTYHIKIAVADVGDGVFDSGVFLKGGGVNCVDANLEVTDVVNHITCLGAGSIDVTVNNGTGPFVYNWVGPNGFTATTEDLSGLAQGGDYTIDIQGADCLSSGSFTYTVLADTFLPAPTSLSKCFCIDSVAYALSSAESYFFTDPVPGAVQYEFLVVNDSLGVHDTIPGGFAPGVNPRYTSLVNLPPSKLHYSTTYSVSVRYQNNNCWSLFGPACDIATPVLPVPRVCGEFCGDTLPAENTSLSAVCEVPLIQSTAYRSAYQMEFRFVNLTNNDTATTIGVGHSWGRPWIASFAQLDASFVQPNTTYSVDVRVMINGVWGVYGPDCLLTTPANTRRSDSRTEGEGSGIAEERTDGFFRSDIKEDRAGMTVYPNPGKEGSEILLSVENPGKTYNAVDVMVLDVYGKQVYHKNIRFSGDGFRTPIQFDRPLTPGVYFVHVHAGEIQMSRKLIIR